jgi:hypothetical protein
VALHQSHPKAPSALEITRSSASFELSGIEAAGQLVSFGVLTTDDFDIVYYGSQHSVLSQVR